MSSSAKRKLMAGFEVTLTVYVLAYVMAWFAISKPIGGDTSGAEAFVLLVWATINVLLFLVGSVAIFAAAVLGLIALLRLLTGTENSCVRRLLFVAGLAASGLVLRLGTACAAAVLIDRLL